MIDTGSFWFQSLVFLAYYTCFAAISVLARHLFPNASEVTRKLYHVFCSLSIFILLCLFQEWFFAWLTVTALFAFSWLIVFLTQNIRVLERLNISRKGGDIELQRQILYVGVAFSVLIYLFWGRGGDANRFFAAVGLLVWGFGDAAAAIMGRRFGKRRFRCRLADSEKTVFGSVSFAVISLVVLLPLLYFPLGITGWQIFPLACILACSGALIELFCRKGSDNLLIPVLISGEAYFIVSVLAYYGYAIR